MVNGTNVEQPLSGEALSSRPKRQRSLSTEIDGGTVSGNVVARAGTLFELDLLDCPICYHPLRSPIFQCENGHIVCSTCRRKLNNKCPSCTLRIGNYRSRIMEKVVEAVIVPCPNVKRGCTKKFSYGKETAHEKECIFTLCYCPEPNCNYSGQYKDLYGHYKANHKANYSWFKCRQYTDVGLRISEGVLVLQEYEDGPLVVVQCFKASHGVYVTMNCIAPSAPGVGEFSYHLIYRKGSECIKFESEEMHRIQKVSLQTPENYMFIPYYNLEDSSILKMEFCIRRLGEEVSKEEDDEDDEDKDEDEEE